LITDFEDLETGAQVVLVGIGVFLIYSLIQAINPSSSGNWLSNLWDGIVGAAPIGSGAQSSTPTSTFWSMTECLLSLGNSCPDSGGGSGSTGSSVFSPNSQGSDTGDSGTIDGNSTGYSGSSS
jgi:hypothetical protein